MQRFDQGLLDDILLIRNLVIKFFSISVDWVLYILLLFVRLFSLVFWMILMYFFFRMLAVRIVVLELDERLFIFLYIFIFIIFMKFF